MKWQKWLFLIVTILVIAIVSLYIIRAKQIKDFKARLVAPQHETAQTILDYAKAKNIPGNILVAKDTAGFRTIAARFGPGIICVLDANKKIVDINYSNYDGSCYFDIAENICNGFDLEKVDYNHEINDEDFVDKLMSSTTPITDFSWDSIANYDYTIIYSWAKWDTTSYTNEGAVERISNCIKADATHKYQMVSVNGDAVAPWYPVAADLPVFQ